MLLILFKTLPGTLKKEAQERLNVLFGTFSKRRNLMARSAIPKETKKATQVEDGKITTSSNVRNTRGWRHIKVC